MSDKNELRRKIRSIKPDDEYVNGASKQITDKLLELDVFKHAESIFCYLSTEKEVCTDEIIEHALKDKKVYVPKCVDEHNMIAIRYRKGDELETGRYGIPEPVNDEKQETDFDVIIVPCLAAGKDLARLGHGKGYYDRFLKNSKAFKICLCLDKLICNDIPMGPDDVYMDMVITENETYVRL